MSLPVVSVNGTQLWCDGQPWHYVGIDAFGLFKRWLMPDGPNALVKPWLTEQRQIAQLGGYTGPIVLRVFRFAAYWNSFALDPWSYHSSEIGDFTRFVGDLGFYVDWTCGDAQQVLPEPDGPTGQQEHLNRTCAALVGVSNALCVQTCNEPFKNGIDVVRIIPPSWGTYLRDSGYYAEIQQWDAALNLDIVCYHSGRDDGGLAPWPKYLVDMNDQAAVLLHAFGKPLKLEEPIGFAESPSPGRRTNRPDVAFLLGQTAGYAGITFHFDDGIDCNSPRPVQRTCEIAFFAGVKGAIA